MLSNTDFCLVFIVIRNIFSPVLLKFCFEWLKARILSKVESYKIFPFTPVDSSTGEIRKMGSPRKSADNRNSKSKGSPLLLSFLKYYKHLGYYWTFTRQLIFIHF